MMRVQGFQKRLISEYFGVGAQIVQNEGGLSAVMRQGVRTGGGQIHRQAQLFRIQAADSGFAYAGLPVSPDDPAVSPAIGFLAPTMFGIVPGAGNLIPVLGISNRVNVVLVVIRGNGPIGALFQDFLEGSLLAGTFQESGDIKVCLDSFQGILMLSRLVLVQVVLDGKELAGLDALYLIGRCVKPFGNVLKLHIVLPKIQIQVIMRLFELSVVIQVLVMEDIGVLLDGLLALDN